MAAAVVDGAVLGVLSFVLGVIAGLLAFALSGDGALDGLNRVLDGPAGTLMGLVVAWLYFVPLESSRLEASLGKRLLGLRVTDLEGRRLSFLRATGRHFGKLLSVATLFIVENPGERPPPKRRVTALHGASRAPSGPARRRSATPTRGRPPGSARRPRG